MTEPEDEQHTRLEQCTWRCRQRFTAAHLGDDRVCTGDPYYLHDECKVPELVAGAVHAAPPLCAHRSQRCNQRRVRRSPFCVDHT